MVSPISTLSHPRCWFQGRSFVLLTGLAFAERWTESDRGQDSRGRLMVKFSWLVDPRPPSVSSSVSCPMPLCGPPRPSPLVLWPLTSTPSVLLSTHCVPLKEPRGQSGSSEGENASLPWPVCSRLPLCGVWSSNQVQLQDKKNPHPHRYALCVPREMHPQCLLSFTAAHLWHQTCSPFILFSMPPSFVSSFHLLLCHHAICAVLFLITLPPPLFSQLLFRHASLFPFSSFIFSLLSLYLLSDLLCSVHLSFSVARDTPQSGNRPIPTLPLRPSARPRG